MTSESPVTANAQLEPSASELPHSGKSSRKRRKPMSQERLMIMFTLFFIVGVLLLVIMPEGNAVRGIAMTIYMVAVFWAMFQFGR